MRSTRPLRPAHPVRRRTLATAAVALGAAFGMVTLTGLTAAAATVGDESSTRATSFVAVPSTPADALAESVREIKADATATLDAAHAALAGAAQVSADIAASGLDVGVATTAVDTAALRERIEGLSDLQTLPLLLLPAMAEGVKDEAKRVNAQTADLRESLEAAQAQRAAEEAAAQAQREAEAAAAAAAAEAAAAAAANTPDGAKATARQLASERGWGGDQFSCLESLWNRESGWNYQAYNSSSGATGIPQSLPGSKMASAGADWQTNATTQIRWGLDYIARGYGSPCSAWGHSQATGWY